MLSQGPPKQSVPPDQAALAINYNELEVTAQNHQPSAVPLSS